MNRSTSRTTPRVDTSRRRRATLLGGICLALGAALSTAHADGALYRWSEPDGALTFSPTPPADGTPYVEVDPMTMRPRTAAGADETSAPATGAAAAAVVRREAPSPTTAAPLDADTVVRTDAATPRPSVVTAAPVRATPTPVPANGGERGTTAASSGEKVERCGELRKRVVSLERRLATPLTPEDMDNTVVHMARYQQSFDRHCR